MASKVPGLVFEIVEFDLLWVQAAFVEVTMSTSRMTRNEAVVHMGEDWRKTWRGAGLIPDGTIDFGAFICRGCKQFSKYKFCPHCVMCGAFLRASPWKPPIHGASSLPNPFVFPNRLRTTKGIEGDSRGGGASATKSNRYGTETAASPGTGASRAERSSQTGSGRRRGGGVARPAPFSGQTRDRQQSRSFPRPRQ